MFTAPATPEEIRQIHDRFRRYRTSFGIVAVITLGLSLGMIASHLVLPAIILAGVGAFGSMLLFGRMQTYKAALGEATLTVFRGPVEKKEQHPSSLGFKKHFLFVDGENHTVPEGFFFGVDVGDTVELHFCRYTRLLTFARLLGRKDVQAVAAAPTPAEEPRPYAPSLPAMLMYAQPADLGEYDRHHDAFSQEPGRFQGTLSPGVSYDDPTVAVRLCTTCRFPVDAVTGRCDRCSPPTS